MKNNVNIKKKEQEGDKQGRRAISGEEGRRDFCLAFLLTLSIPKSFLREPYSAYLPSGACGNGSSRPVFIGDAVKALCVCVRVCGLDYFISVFPHIFLYRFLCRFPLRAVNAYLHLTVSCCHTTHFHGFTSVSQSVC